MVFTHARLVTRLAMTRNGTRIVRLVAKLQPEQIAIFGNVETNQEEGLQAPEGVVEARVRHLPPKPQQRGLFH
jgi:hypothetical protein